MYYHTYGLRVGIARCGNIFGGGDLNWSRIVPARSARSCAANVPVVRSDGKYVRRLLLREGRLARLPTPGRAPRRRQIAGEAFNFSNESPLNVLEVVGVIQKLMDAATSSPTCANVVEGEIHKPVLSARARARGARLDARVRPGCGALRDDRVVPADFSRGAGRDHGVELPPASVRSPTSAARSCTCSAGRSWCLRIREIYFFCRLPGRDQGLAPHGG